MDDLDKKIIITSAGYELSQNATRHEISKLYALALAKPVSGAISCLFKELLIDHLEKIASTASLQRNKIDWRVQGGLSWELKATTRLFYEAISVISFVSESLSVHEFKNTVREKLQEKGLDWGYGSNWSASVHHFVMRKMTAELSRFIDDLPAINCDSMCHCRE